MVTEIFFQILIFDSKCIFFCILFYKMEQMPLARKRRKDTETM